MICATIPAFKGFYTCKNYCVENLNTVSKICISYFASGGVSPSAQVKLCLWGGTSYRGRVKWMGSLQWGSLQWMLGDWGLYVPKFSKIVNDLNPSFMINIFKLKIRY